MMAREVVLDKSIDAAELASLDKASSRCLGGPSYGGSHCFGTSSPIPYRFFTSVLWPNHKCRDGMMICLYSKLRGLHETPPNTAHALPSYESM